MAERLVPRDRLAEELSNLTAHGEVVRSIVPSVVDPDCYVVTTERVSPLADRAEDRRVTR